MIFDNMQDNFNDNISGDILREAFSLTIEDTVAVLTHCNAIYKAESDTDSTNVLRNFPQYVDMHSDRQIKEVELKKTIILIKTAFQVALNDSEEDVNMKADTYYRLIQCNRTEDAKIILSPFFAIFMLSKFKVKKSIAVQFLVRRIQLASATPSRLNEKARWYSTLASPSNQRLRGVWAMHTLPGKNGTTSARQ